MKELRHQTIQYFKYGADPKVAFLAGTHGDEHEVIGIATKIISEHKDCLPDFIFIPEVSPSAVKAKSRMNRWGRDVNRNFHDKTEDPEARANMEILKKHDIDICISFHEDPDLERGFYFYDSQKMMDKKLKRLRTAMKENGVELYSGIDDPDLELEIKDGYWHADESYEPGNALIDWVVNEGTANRVIEVEIPGKASLNRKRKITNTFFKHAVLPLVQ